MNSVAAETASGGGKLGHPGLPLTWFDLLAGIVLPVACLVADYSLLAGIVRFAPIGLPSFAALGMAGFLFSGKVSMTTPVRDLILGAIIGASIVLTCLAALLLVFAYVMFRVALDAIFDDGSSTPISFILGVFGMAALGVSPMLTAFVYIRRALKLLVIDRRPSWLLMLLGIVAILAVPIALQMAETSWIRRQLEQLRSNDANVQVEVLQTLNRYPVWPVWLTFNGVNSAVCSIARRGADGDPIQQELQRMLGPDPVRTCNDRAVD